MRRIRCLYCGGKYWRPFKWLRDGEFCCDEHRQSYQGRLRKIAVNLTEVESLAEVSLTAEDPESEAEPAPEHAPPPLAAFAPVVPGIPAPAAAPTPEPALPLAAFAPIVPEILAPEPAPSLAAFAPVVPGIPAPAPLERGRAVTESLPASFETQARIKRWGLRMRFRH